MAKLILTDLTSLANSPSAIAQINANMAAIELAVENTLSRDGTSPNAMESDLDMNSNRIINLPRAATSSEPPTLAQVEDMIDAISIPDPEIEYNLGITRSLESFGCTGDGVTDDTTAMQTAFNSGYALHGTIGATYRITNTISRTGNVYIDWGQSNVYVDANVDAFKFYNQVNLYAFSGNYTKGSTSLSINTMDTSHIPARGDLVKVTSNAVDPSNRDNGSSTNQYRVGEWLQVASSTATTITLRHPILFPIGISPTSTAGDEARVDAYTTALNARVLTLGNYKFFMKGGKFYYRDGHEATPWTAILMTLYGYRDPVVENMVVTKGYGSGLRLMGTVNARVINPFFKNLENDLAQDQYGYGINDAGYGTQVINPTVRDVRHGYTTGALTAVADSTDTARLLGVGRVQNAVITNGDGWSDSATPWDTHLCAEGVRFVNCVGRGNEYGFSLRGRATLINPVVRAHQGIYVFTEYDSGDTNDDYFTAGKETQDLTNVTIINPDIECEQDPFTVSQAFCKIINPTVKSAATPFVFTSGEVTAAGLGRFELTRMDSRYTSFGGTAAGGFVEMEKENTYLNTPLNTLFYLVDGADWAFDAINHTVANYGIKADSDDCTAKINGRLRFAFAAGASGLLSSLGTFETSNNTGLIEYSVNAAADNSITTNLSGTSVRAIALDGTIAFDGTTNVSTDSIKRLYTSNAVGVSHAGTGAEVEIYLPPGQTCGTLMGAGGNDRIRFKISGTKTGGAGVPTLYIRSASTNFVDDIPLLNSAGTVGWYLDIEVLFPSNANQTYLIQGWSSDGTSSESYYRRVTETQSASSLTYLVRLGVDAAVGMTVTVDSCEVTGTRGGVIA